MRRTLEGVSEMAQALTAERNSSPGKRRLYETDGNSGKGAAALSSNIAGRITTIETLDGRTKVNWDDLPTIKERVAGYVEACAEAGTIPSVEGLAVHALGVSKRRLNAYISNNSSTTAEYLTCVKDIFADILQSASLGNRVNVVAAIFTLKNSFGFRDSVEISATPPSTEADYAPEELLKQIDALPDD